MQLKVQASLYVFAGLFIFDFMDDLFKGDDVEHLLENVLVWNFEKLPQLGLLDKNVGVDNQCNFVGSR